MKVEAEVELAGQLGPHIVRIEFELELAKRATSPFMNASTGAMIDAGDPPEGGSAQVLRAWVLIVKDGRTIRARELPRDKVKKLRNDRRLEDFLYENALAGFPDA